MFRWCQRMRTYKIYLIPADLSSPETSKVGWTVVQKPCARHKALRAMGLHILRIPLDSYGYQRVLTGFVPLYDLGLSIREAKEDTQVPNPPDYRILV